MNSHRSFPAHLVSVRDLDHAMVQDVFSGAAAFRDMPRAEAAALLRGYVVAMMFYQPSTRTRLGFEAAALRLGASVIGFADPSTTRSVDYIGETLEDTIHVVAELSDAIVMRHFVAGAASRAAAVSSRPILNGGDGSNEHPTQALTDAWVMASRLGDLEGAVIGLVGDPGTRVLRSLTLLLALLKVKRILFLVPPSAPLMSWYASSSFVHTTLPGDLRAALDAHGIEYDFRSDVSDLLTEADAIEMMPIDIPALEAVPASLRKQQNITPEQFRVTAAKIHATGSKTLVLHPGPRKDELHPEVDSLPNGLYFDQVRESVYVRMAVLAQLCGVNLRRTDRPDAAGVQEATP